MISTFYPLLIWQNRFLIISYISLFQFQ